MVGNVIFHEIFIHALENVLALCGLNNKSVVGEFFSCFAEFDVGFRTISACLLFKCLSDLDGVLLVVDGDVGHVDAAVKGGVYVARLRAEFPNDCLREAGLSRAGDGGMEEELP